MRNWLRERMTRRKNKTANESESFGKVGQELPTRSAGQLAPLQPSYDFKAPEEAHSEPEAAPGQPAVAPHATPRGAAGSEQQPERRARRSRRGGKRRSAKKAAVVQQPPAISESAAEITEPVDETDDFGNEFALSTGKMETETQPDSPSVPPAAQEPISAEGQASAKAIRGIVVLAIGLPGSGKTTWFKRRGVTPLSSDLLRNLLFDDITEQRYQGLVFSTLRSLLRARLIAKMPWNYVDATNLSAHERRQWIKMSRSFGYEVHAVFFNVPIEVCLARNARRERRVDPEMITSMSERLRPPSFKEGFSKIVVVKVKDPQKAIEQAQNPQHFNININMDMDVPPEEGEVE
ncbi:MAG: ATP-binding protein [Acidobacteriaceae bacterium]